MGQLAIPIADRRMKGVIAKLGVQEAWSETAA
jgi:hypothetical protein